MRVGVSPDIRAHEAMQTCGIDACASSPCHPDSECRLLAPDQFDQNELPEYDLLDGILEGLIEREESVATLADPAEEACLAAFRPMERDPAVMVAVVDMAVVAVAVDTVVIVVVVVAMVAVVDPVVVEDLAVVVQEVVDMVVHVVVLVVVVEIDLIVIKWIINNIHLLHIQIVNCQTCFNLVILSIPQ